MEFRPLHLFIFVAPAFVTSHAAPPAERYWNSVLPNSPMPKAVKDLLQSNVMEDKSTSVGVSGGGVDVDTQGGNPGGTNVNVGHGGVGNPGGTSVNVGHDGGGGDQRQGGNPGDTDVNVRHGGRITVISGHHRGKPVYEVVVPGPQPFLYNYAATNNQLHDKPNVALFFLENNITQRLKDALAFLQDFIWSHFRASPGC